MKQNIRLSLRRFFYTKIPEELVRLVTSYRYDKEAFALYMKQKMDNSSDIFTGIYETNLWHTEESVSGGGSTMDATNTVRAELPKIIGKYQIKSMLDIPCGDYNWMRFVDKKCEYIGGDIVSEIIERNKKEHTEEPNVSFQVLNMTQDKLPKVDMIFCKDCFQHLAYENVAAAINNFKKSGSKYLLVSSYPKTWRNHDIYDGDYRPLNIRKKPFNLPKPIYEFREESIAEGVESDKFMYLYELDSIPFIKL